MSPLLKKCKFFFVMKILGFLFLLSPQLVCAAIANPMGLIQNGTEKAIGMLHQSSSGQAPALRQRRDEIQAVVEQYFNFEEMAKRALGRPWKEQPPDKREEYARLFKQLIFNTYIDRLEGYTGSHFQASYDSEKLEGDYALVKTHILYGNNNVEIDYRLHLDQGQWKVYDVVVEGVSIVENYRSQFMSILTNQPFDSLLNMLRQKVQQSS